MLFHDFDASRNCYPYNYSYPPTLADNLSPIGRETPRVDGSVSLVDRKFFCIQTHTLKKIYYLIAFIKCFINLLYILLI